MNNTLSEIMEEFEKERSTFRWKVKYYLRKLTVPFYKIKKFPRKIKFAYQRVTRGFSDQDAWNGDMYLASQIAGIAEWLVENGHGVPMSYAYQPDLNDSVEIMAERRNTEYCKHIAVFREYAKNGPAFDQEWEEELGGVLDKDLDESLQWFAKHFVELWD